MQNFFNLLLFLLSHFYCLNLQTFEKCCIQNYIYNYNIDFIEYQNFVDIYHIYKIFQQIFTLREITLIAI